MPRQRHKPLADAHQENRRLRNRIHELEQAQLPHLARVNALESQNAVLERRAASAERLGNAYGQFFHALVILGSELISSGRLATVKGK